MVNIPITDKFAMRAQAAYLSQDGFVTRGTQNLGAARTSWEDCSSPTISRTG